MIGVFDSGFGGLTVFKEIRRVLPEYDYLYLGDNARAPYGNHSPEVVYQYTEQAVDFLFKQGCELIILACNTASAAALRRIQQEYLPAVAPNRRVLGVVRPIVEKAVGLTKTGRIGVIGTRVTVESGAYQRELEEQVAKQAVKLGQPLKIFQAACPLLVPLIEEGWLKRQETKSILRYYLRPLKEKKIDVLLLGCTHYPLLIKEIQAVMGKNCQVMNPGKVVAESLKDYLKRHGEIESKLARSRQVKYLTTDASARFQQLASRFMGQGITAEKISLGAK